MLVWSHVLGEPGISAAQEGGRLAVTLHGCTPLVRASQTVPRLPRPSASRHAHDPAIANLIQRASSFPLSEARLLILTECRRIAARWPRHLPDSPKIDSDKLPPPSRHRQTRLGRMCHTMKGNRPTNASFSSMKEMLCASWTEMTHRSDDSPHNAAADDRCTLMQCAL